MKSCAAACKQRMSGEYNMGLVKTRRLAAMHPPPPAATADKQAAAREGGDAYEGFAQGDV